MSADDLLKGGIGIAAPEVGLVASAGHAVLGSKTRRIKLALVGTIIPFGLVPFGLFINIFILAALFLTFSLSAKYLPIVNSQSGFGAQLPYICIYVLPLYFVLSFTINYLVITLENKVASAL